jgi:hypothetical protein
MTVFLRPLDGRQRRGSHLGYLCRDGWRNAQSKTTNALLVNPALMGVEDFRRSVADDGFFHGLNIIVHCRQARRGRVIESTTPARYTNPCRLGHDIAMIDWATSEISCDLSS